MDFKEDFEFKPLSEGLGFHPRKNKQNSSSAEEMTADFEATTPITTKNSSSEKSGGGVYFLDLDDSTTPDEFYDPPVKKSFSDTPTLPAVKEAVKMASASFVESQNTPVPTTGTKKNTPDAKKTVDDILSSMKNRNQVLENKLDMKAKAPAAMPAARVQKNQQTQVTARTSPYGFQAVVPSLVKTEMSFTAAFLDGLLVVASCLICLIILLSVTRMDLIALITQSGKSEIYFSTFMLFAVVSLIYLTATRVFLGSTPGEWAFDQQAGTEEDQQDLNYMLKVLYRSVLVIGSGFILFPIASFAMAKDLLGDITGVHLYTRK